MGSRQESVDALKHTLKTFGVEFFMGWLATHLPFTQLPILKTIFKAIFKKLADDMLDLSEFAIFIVYIDLRVDAQGISMMDAMIENWRAQNNPGVSTDEKKKAEFKLKDRFANFVVLGA